MTILDHIINAHGVIRMLYYIIFRDGKLNNNKIYVGYLI